MKVKFYLIPLLLFLFTQSKAQDCSTLTVTYTTSESRCVATGSINVSVSGGSGSYNYKAIGPITSPLTSTNIITGLPTGYYSILIKDLVTGCSKQVDSAFVAGTYSDPRFQLTKTDASCAGNDGTVSMINQQFGRSPFTYSIISPSPSGVGTTNTTGTFTGLTPGEYSIQLHDSCGGIQVRKITIENYSWWFDSVSVVPFGCDSAHVFLRLKDNKNNVNTSGTAFNGFTYGYIQYDGDTTWGSPGSFNAFLSKMRSLVIVVKDNCGNLHSTVWSLPSSIKPSLSNVSLTSFQCSTVTATVTSLNIASPSFCLYDGNNVLITCGPSGVFSNLAYGSYCIQVRDLCYDTTITRCFSVSHPVPAIASSVSITNKNCNTFTATVTGQQNLTSPQYCVYNSLNVVVACNTTGVFNNLTYGDYCIETKDGCIDTTIKRCFTVTKPVPVLTSYAISGLNCSNFNVNVSGTNLNTPLYCLYDNAGNVVTCDSSGSFTGIANGSYCVRAISCGDTTNSLCFSTASPVPALGAGVQITNRKCATFGVSVWGQINLTTPQYCLYDQNDSLLACNTTGSFDSLAYGFYCIKMRNTCFDTTITRCFSLSQSVPSVDGVMQTLSTTCSTVSFKVTGTNLVTPTYCLYNAADSLLSCNATGIFNNQPYGQYCVTVDDGCVDTVMRVCQTFTPVKGISLTTSKSCTIGNTFIDVQFANGNAPFNIKVYHPNGSLIYDGTTSSNPFRIELTPIPVSIQYKVVGTDNCGNKDSASIIPDANVVAKSISIRSKCPSSTWLNGAGDIMATCSTNYHSVMPQIIKKNGVAFVSSFSSVTANTYTFADLEPAQYIVEYTQQTCNSKVYDTVTVSPYAYPTQGQAAIYQCDNNSFSLGADVQGGVNPYTFQIIGSMPETPDITTAPQSSPVFDINTGTVYSLVRLRTIDACGNATLSDVSVLPLQNISVSASNLCFFQNILLTVDTIPNATYQWYRKRSSTDSTLIGTGLSYNLPFFVPEEMGEYICKMTVNNGCMIRQANFTLDGDCGNMLLPVSFQLKGQKMGNYNQLFWYNADETGISEYIVERKRANERNYTTLSTLPVQSGNYAVRDNDPGTGTTLYRIKVVHEGKARYSNIVKLTTAGGQVLVYPNPVQQQLHISFNATRPASYRIDIVNAGGQMIFSNEIKNTRATVITYTRGKQVQPGIYIIRITDTDTGATDFRKVLFE